ncbi:MAG: hypothetical protein Q9Q13_09300, partial [Acidobacteriota bacterium]|nr:hypothetical protein [Acidobacteriota bacterium]
MSIDDLVEVLVLEHQDVHRLLEGDVGQLHADFLFLVQFLVVNEVDSRTLRQCLIDLADGGIREIQHDRNIRRGIQLGWTVVLRPLGRLPPGEVVLRRTTAPTLLLRQGLSSSTAAY